MAKATERRWIGLVGRAGVGKDHALRAMKEIDPDVERIAFADGVRLEIEKIVAGGQRLPVLWEKPYADEIRRLLQWWGTDLRRAQDSEYWVNNGMNRAMELQIGAKKVPVFTDVRFLNEAEMIKSRGGILVRVEATQEVRRERLGELPPEHPSEAESDEIKCGWTIPSNGTDPEGYQRELSYLLAVSGAEFA